MINSVKKLLAAGGVALGLAGFGMFVAAGAATADGTLPDTGSYDETHNVPKDPIQSGPITGSYYGQEGSYDDFLNILDDDGFQAARP